MNGFANGCVGESTDGWLDVWMNVCDDCLLVAAWAYGRLIHARGPLLIGLGVLREDRGPAGLLPTNNQHTYIHPAMRPIIHPLNHPSAHSPIYPFSHPFIHPPIRSSTHTSGNVPIHPFT